MPADAAATGRMAWLARLGPATSLARTLDFDAAHPRVFGAPPAASTPLIVGAFNGEVARGASCNCRSVTLVPHCNGTHTESAAHLTVEPLRVGDVVPLEPLPALLLSVTPVEVEHCTETADPPPQRGDYLISAARIAAAWAAFATPPGTGGPASAPQVLVVRSGATPPGSAAAFFSLEAMQLIVARGIEHLIVELPSVDRAEDQGRLGAHRVFFGLPPGSSSLADAQRAHATITELAAVPASCADGPCAVQLQLTAWSGDAVPSRPVLFALAVA